MLLVARKAHHGDTKLLYRLWDHDLKNPQEILSGVGFPSCVHRAHQIALLVHVNGDTNDRVQVLNPRFSTMEKGEFVATIILQGCRLSRIKFAARREKERGKERKAILRAIYGMT